MSSPGAQAQSVPQRMLSESASRGNSLRTKQIEFLPTHAYEYSWKSTLALPIKKNKITYVGRLAPRILGSDPPRRILSPSACWPTRGAKRCAATDPSRSDSFNPRPRTGRDVSRVQAPAQSRQFQSTRLVARHHQRIGVSIHAPRAGRDLQWDERPASPDVSIHAPHAGRDATALTIRIVRDKFQSTHPARGATTGPLRQRRPSRVSIHAPARGATLHKWLYAMYLLVFQSTHPRGVRRADDGLQVGGKHVSIHAPARGATTGFPHLLRPFQSFNPRTRAGCDYLYFILKI